MKWLVLTIVAAACASSNPSIRVGLRTSQIDLLKGAILEYIQPNFTDVTVPGFDEDILFFRIMAENNTIHVDPANASQLEFTLLNGTTDFLVHAHNLSTVGYSNTTIKLLFLTHHCRLTIVCARASFTARISVSTVGPRLSLVVKSMIYDIKTDDISIEVSGNLINDVLDTLVRLRKRFFIGEMKRCMLRMLPNMIAGIFNQILLDIPDDMTDGSGVAISLAMTAPTEIIGGYMIGSVFAIAHPAGNSTVPPGEPLPLPKFNRECEQGAQIMLSTYLINTVAETAHAVGLLRHAVEFGALGFVFLLQVETAEAPVAYINGTINGTLSVRIGLGMKHSSWEHFYGLSMSISGVGDVDQHINDSVVYFEIISAKCTGIALEIGPIRYRFLLLPILLNPLISVLTDLVVNKFGRRGVALPDFPFFEIHSASERVNGTHLFICATLVPKFAHFLQLIP